MESFHEKLQAPHRNRTARRLGTEPPPTVQDETARRRLHLQGVEKTTHSGKHNPRRARASIYPLFLTLQVSSCLPPSADQESPPALPPLPPLPEKLPVLLDDNRGDSHTRERPSDPPTTPWTGRLPRPGPAAPELTPPVPAKPQALGENFWRTLSTIFRSRACGVGPEGAGAGGIMSDGATPARPVLWGDGDRRIQTEQTVGRASRLGKGKEHPAKQLTRN